MHQSVKNIAILGSTGSIGTQALDVIEANPTLFCVQVLTAQTNVDLLIAQSLKFNPRAVVICDESKYQQLKDALKHTEIEVKAGEEALCEVVVLPGVTMVLTALVGFAGLKPTMAAIKAGKHIALANKETLVVAGELINALAKQYQVDILPVDSEHSAIFQCLVGEKSPIEKIYLTASGGPFRGESIEFLSTATKDQALKHPNWVMGAKITIDSATLMNKGLEVIEAKWLFDLTTEQIDVIVHPQSIVHSIVQFQDGSMKAQMGVPDMKLPIQYAMAYPNRVKNDFKRFNFLDHPTLTFEPANTKIFRNLALAFEALQKAGNMPCIINAANEVVVAEFLKDEIGFLQMSEVIETCMAKVAYIKEPTLADYFETDKQTRIFAKHLVKSI
ncbi:1-deoxy-D-xylulose-5-phosphate reductoisomerase [Pedobacter arcticus]|uniref:1-deoxy-D-xylulose-5-phosphate reductoisomerase n=1 Tax=Pedobacter arcticus TaxID=752140 RepID=UPI00031CBD77|nr:1-deoxy-D-xylulose-5-phosphate reductoisomerase [Pedobacter arcticus]